MNHEKKSTQWTDPRPLPSGWQERLDPTSRRKFYVNHNTRKTSWNDPRPPLESLMKAGRIANALPQNSHKLMAELNSGERWTGLCAVENVDEPPVELKNINFGGITTRFVNGDFVTECTVSDLPSTLTYSEFGKKALAELHMTDLQADFSYINNSVSTHTCFIYN